MSTINIWRVETSENPDEVFVPTLEKVRADVAESDTETLLAVVRVLRLLDELDNGEAIVITRDIW